MPGFNSGPDIRLYVEVEAALGDKCEAGGQVKLDEA